MIKNVIVTFQFDPETETVSDVQCSVDGVEKKKRTTRKKSDVEEEIAAEPLITREETKLVFNNKVVLDMDIHPGDRVVIKWEKVKGTKQVFPIIGKGIAFDEEDSGNKITKTFTMGYKGSQNTVLAEVGSQFTIEPYKEGIWKLISTTSANTCRTIEETIKVVEKVNADIITETDEDTKIDKLQFIL